MRYATFYRDEATKEDKDNEVHKGDVIEMQTGDKWLVQKVEDGGVILARSYRWYDWVVAFVWVHLLFQKSPAWHTTVAYPKNGNR